MYWVLGVIILNILGKNYELSIGGEIRGYEFKIQYMQTKKYRKCARVTNVMYKEGKEIYGDEFIDFVKNKLTEYSANTDNITKDHLNYLYTCLYNKEKRGDCCPANFYYLSRTRQQFIHDKNNSILDKFIINRKIEEVFVNYHGMRYARPEVKEYLQN